MLDQVPVGRHWVTISRVPRKELDVGTIGHYCTRAGLSIRVADDLEQMMEKETVCHEIIHSWFHLSGLQNVVNEDMGEAICDSFSAYLAQLLDLVKENRGRVKG